MRKHFHNDDDQHDALNDYLEAHVGFPPADSRAGQLAPDMRDTVEEFLDLAERAGAIPSAQSQQRRPAMNATLPVSGALPATAPKQSRRRTQPSLTLPAWIRHLHMLSTVLLIAAIAALSFAAFGPNGIGGDNNGGTGDGPDMFSAVPIATVPDGTESSSIPYPTPDECTVEPMTRVEVIEHLNEANALASQGNSVPVVDVPTYERNLVPTDEQAQAIMQTYREYQACGLEGRALAYRMQLETPRYTSDQLALFYLNEPPVSDELIKEWADIVVSAEDVQAAPMTATGTPSPDPATPIGLPIPAGATPVVYESGRASPTIFAEDIDIVGPDIAVAEAYFVNPETGEVRTTTPLTFWFKNVDGQWLLHWYSEGRLG